MTGEVLRGGFAERQGLSLGEVQVTLLVPLYARALETQRPDALIRDPTAVRLVQSIAYDFWHLGQAPEESVLRAAIFDELVADFLGTHPCATVVDVGVGLNTRHERADNGRACWVDVDLPDVIELRRRCLAANDRRTTVAGSLLEREWPGLAKRCPAPYLIVIEGVLMYFAEHEVRWALTLLADAFPGAVVAFDTAAVSLMGSAGARVARGTRARLRWWCDDARQVEEWDRRYALQRSWSLATLPPPLARRLPFRYQFIQAQLRVLERDEWNQYRVNVFTIQES